MLAFVSTARFLSPVWLNLPSQKRHVCAVDLAGGVLPAGRGDQRYLDAVPHRLLLGGACKSFLLPFLHQTKCGLKCRPSHSFVGQPPRTPWQLLLCKATMRLCACAGPCGKRRCVRRQHHEARHEQCGHPVGYRAVEDTLRVVPLPGQFRWPGTCLQRHSLGLSCMRPVTVSHGRHSPA